MNYNTNQEVFLRVTSVMRHNKKGGGNVNTSNQCLNYHIAAAPLLT